MDTCICLAEALHCFPVTTTALLISYTPVQNVFGVKKIFFFLLKYNCFQFSSVAQLCLTLCDPMDYSTQSLLKLMSIALVMPFNHLILCCPLLLLPSIFSSIRVFSNESVLLIRWPKYWSFSFNICPSNEYSGLISFRMDWLDLLAVQGTLKSLL